jgi:Rhodanese-related sulfurtransferase
MKKVLAFVGGVLLLVNTAFAYDAKLAKKLDEVFSKQTPELIKITRLPTPDELKPRPCEISHKKWVETLARHDAELAKRLDELLSQLPPHIKQTPCEVDGKMLLDMMHKKEPFVILDIRTPIELEIVGFTWKDTLNIPLNELFKEENLRKLPKDKKIIVVCRTRVRASAAVWALRAVGFPNAYVLNDGIVGLADTINKKPKR